MPNVKNDEFLKNIFRDYLPQALVCGFIEDPTSGFWSSHLFSKDGAIKIQKNTSNNYYCISTFSGTGSNRPLRRKHLFERCFVIILDDIGTKIKKNPRFNSYTEHLPPSYIIETSPGNEQWGYIIEEADGMPGDPRLWAVEQVFSRLITLGLTDKGCKGVTRYARLPIGSNTKSEHLIDGKTPPEHRLVFWHPDIRYTLDHISMRLGEALDPPDQQRLTPLHTSVQPDQTLERLDALGLVKQYDPTTGIAALYCPWRSEHTGGDTSGTYYYVRGSRTSQGVVRDFGGFLCNHSHCEHRGLAELNRWLRGDMTAVIAKEHQIDTTDPHPAERFKIQKNWITEPPPPVEWLIQDILERGEPGEIFGVPGGGKSIAVLQLLIALASGSKVWGVYDAPHPVGVLGINAEDSMKIIRRRFYQIVQTLDSDILGNSVIDTDTLLKNFHVGESIESREAGNLLTAYMDGLLCDTGLVSGLLEICNDISNLGLIVLDPLNQFMSGNENSVQDMNVMLKTLTWLKQKLQNKVNILVVHHSNKVGGNHQEASRGSSALPGFVRWMMCMSPMTEAEASLHGYDDADRGRFVAMRVVKSNYTPSLRGTVWLERGPGGILRHVELNEARSQLASDIQVVQRACDLLDRGAAEGKFWTLRGFVKEYAGSPDVRGYGQHRLRELLKKEVDKRGCIAQIVRKNDNGRREKVLGKVAK